MDYVLTLTMDINESRTWYVSPVFVCEQSANFSSILPNSSRLKFTEQHLFGLGLEP